MQAVKQDGQDGYQQALADWERGAYETAARGLRALCRRQPGLAAAHALLGRCLMVLGQGQDALAQFQAAVEAAPSEPEHWQAFGLALLRSDKLKAAGSVLDQARKRGVGGPALTALGTYLQACAQAPVTLAGELRLLSGTLAGQGQPVLLVPLHLRPERIPEPGPNLPGLGAGLIGRALPAAQPGGKAEALARSVLDWAVAMQVSIGQPVFASGALLAPALAQALMADEVGFGPAEACESLMLALPCYDAQVARQTVRWALRAHAALLAAPGDAEVLALLRRDCELLRRQLDQRTSKANTTYNMLRTAAARGLPWQRLSPTSFMFRLGYGAAGRIFNSTLTNQTPAIGTKLANDKALSLHLLRELGLPVPRHLFARDAEAAVRIAAQLGYPVVVKAMNLERGEGVIAGLRDADQVRRAYAEASAHSDYIYVEQHIAGEDHRLLVLGERMIWAYKRVPGGVTGDGRRSVSELLDALNADPRRGTAIDQFLKPLQIDAEARELLAQAGLSLESVPAAGQRVTLRRIANAVRGGDAYDITDIVHPENQRLAVRAARAHSLDLAGIDFICPDITRPWHEVGGAICEVNAQPGIVIFSPEQVFPTIFDELMPGAGRIPIAALSGDAGRCAPAAAMLHRLLCAQGLRAGLASAQGAWIGAERIGWEARDGFAGCRLLLSDTQAEAAVVTLPPAGLAGEGLPFDRCDLVALLPDTPPDPLLQELLKVAGKLVLPAGIALPTGILPPDLAADLSAAQVLWVAQGPEDLPADLAANADAVWAESGDIHIGRPGQALRLPGAADGLDAAALEARLYGLAMAQALGRLPESPAEVVNALD